MAFTKITTEDRQGKGNVGQPDTPLLTTTEMQEQMDSLSNLAIDRFNAHLDELADTTAAQNIGCTVPTGVTAQPNIVSILNAINTVAQSSVEAKHTHTNKATIDAITPELLSQFSALLLLMVNIDTIEPVMTDSATALPTSQAVKNYIEAYNFKNIIKNAIYPIGAVYQTTLVSPDTIFGTTNNWQLIATDDLGVKTYRRIS